MDREWTVNGYLASFTSILKVRKRFIPGEDDIPAVLDMLLDRGDDENWRNLRLFTGRATDEEYHQMASVWTSIYGHEYQFKGQL
jgi:hypothetical protein